MYVVQRLTHKTAVHAVDPDPALREAVGAPKSVVMLYASRETSVGDPEPDPDPHVFEPPGSGTISESSERYGSGSGSFFFHNCVERTEIMLAK